MFFSNSTIRRRAASRSGACTMILLIIGSKWTLISAPSKTPESKRTPGPVGSTTRVIVPAAGTLVGRTTVLPRVVTEEAGLLRLEPNLRSRYTPQRRLGEGAMGEVELSEDHDIGRPVVGGQRIMRLGRNEQDPVGQIELVDQCLDAVVVQVKFIHKFNNFRPQFLILILCLGRK